MNLCHVVHLGLIHKGDSGELSVPAGLGQVTGNGVRLEQNITIGSLEDWALSKWGEQSGRLIKVRYVDCKAVVLSSNQRLEGAEVSTSVGKD